MVSAIATIDPWRRRLRLSVIEASFPLRLCNPAHAAGAFVLAIRTGLSRYDRLTDPHCWRTKTYALPSSHVLLLTHLPPPMLCPDHVSATNDKIAVAARTPRALIRQSLASNSSNTERLASNLSKANRTSASRSLCTPTLRRSLNTRQRSGYRVSTNTTQLACSPSGGRSL